MDLPEPTRRHLLGTVASLGVLPIAAPDGWAADASTTAAPPSPTRMTELTINGQRRTLALDPGITLLDLLREQIALTGHQERLRHGFLRRLHRAHRRHGACCPA